LTQHIAYAPESQQVLARGVERLNRLLCLTLGPAQGRVAVTGASAAELLDDASQVSKQVLSFGNSLEDIGHQCLRSALAGLYERTQDGLATCSVLTAAILKQTAPLLAFGHHPASLQRDLRVAHERAREMLRQRAWVIDTPDEIAAVLRTANTQPAVAEIAAEIVDAIGADGALLVEETRQIGLAHEYIRGGRWSTGIASPALLGGEPHQATIREPSILITDHPVTVMTDAVAVLEAASGARSVLLIAPSFSDDVVALLLANRNEGGFESILAVKAPRSVHSGAGQLEDIAVMTGGRFIPIEHAGGLRAVSPADFGRAERVWASRSAFGIVGGSGAPAAMHQRASELRAQARGESDPPRKAHLSARAGNLTGLSALVRIGTGSRGGPTVRHVERAAAIARSALASGVVAGGGTALALVGQTIACEFRGNTHEAGATALARALAAPMTTIVGQTGREPGALLDRLSPNGDAFDIQKGCWVNARDAGLADPLATMEGALDVAVSTACSILSTEVLIGRRAAR
jgi:chaperonin GroEL